MTNIYILATSNSAPSPWTRSTAYDGRYVIFGANTGQHGYTGGSSTHTHTASSPTGAQNSYNYWAGFASAAGPRYAMPHQHTFTVSAVSSANNDPLFYTMTLWYMDYTTWEANERRFPAGAVLISSGALTWDEVSRHSASDGRRIKLGDAGSTGGSASHSHTMTGTLNATTVGYNTQIQSGVTQATTYNTPILTHTHSVSVSSSTTNNDYYAVATRLYSAASQTVKALSGVICFFDGTPSANWSFINWDGYTLLSANQSATGQGSPSSHNHGGTISGASAAYAGVAGSGYVFNTYAEDSFPISWYAVNHTHTASAAVSSGDILPPYVKLAAYQLQSTLYHINTYTLTETSDLLLKKTKTASASPDIIMKKTMSLVDPMKVLIQKFDIESTLDMDASLLQQYEIELAKTTTRVKKPTDIGIAASVVIAILSNAYDVSMRLVRYWNPAGKPVLDSIMKGWIDEIQTVDNKTQVMYLNNSLNYAIGTELDTKWGEVYELPRLASETDDEYRKRIKTYVTMQTGSGTKSTLEAVIDTITGYEGTSRVETYVPGRVKVFFDTGDALHSAYEHVDLLNYVLPQALSVGVYYDLYISFVDYLLDMLSKGSLTVAYAMDHLEKFTDLETTLDMESTMLNQVEATYDADSLVMSIFQKTTQVVTTILNLFTQTYNITSRIKRSYTETADFTTRILDDHMQAIYTLNQRLLRTRTYIWSIDAEVSKTKDSVYYTSVRLV